MEETRIDRLEERLDELASEVRAGFRAVDTQLCRVESGLDRNTTKISELEKRMDHAATKADLRTIEARLDQTTTKADLSELRSEMYTMNADMKNWMIATTVAIFGTFLAALFGHHHWNG